MTILYKVKNPETGEIQSHNHLNAQDLIRLAGWVGVGTEDISRAVKGNHPGPSTQDIFDGKRVTPTGVTMPPEGSGDEPESEEDDSEGESEKRIAVNKSKKAK